MGDTGKSLNIFCIAKSVVRQSASPGSLITQVHKVLGRLIILKIYKIAIMLEPLSFHPYRLRHYNRMQQSTISLVLHVNKLIKLLSALLYSPHNCKFKPSLNGSRFLQLICPFEVRLTALYYTNKELQYTLMCLPTYGLYLFRFSTYSLRTVHLRKYLV